ncbi:MAG: LysM peptidoglycan-binding domain-containing protein [Spirosomataceae bacterium]
MKKLGLFLILMVALPALGQTIYKVPKNLEFAGIKIRLDDEARELVQKDVNSLMASRRALDVKLERMTMYFPIVEAILEEEEVPNDFKFLVVQESSLMPDAISTSNAVGFWQFKKETAGDFGLRVDTDIDERKSIHASTRAAALYLKRNNAVLNNWIAALYSYRLGLGGVRNLIPKDWAYSDDINVDAKIDWYVLRSLAHKVVFERELADYKASAPMALFEYKFAGGKTINMIANELGVPEEDIRLHNRWLSGTVVPDDKEYLMVVPVPSTRLDEIKNKATASSRTDFIRTDIGFPILKRLTPSVKNKNLPIFYEINGKKGILAQDGDSPATLAQKADIKYEKFMQFNDLKERDRLVPGEVYYLKKKAKKAVVPFHTVTADQTLWKISQIYGIRLECILKYNRLDQVVKLQPGRVLYLRKKRPKNKPIEYINLPEPPAKDPVLAQKEPSSKPPVTPANRPTDSQPDLSQKNPKPAATTPKKEDKPVDSQIDTPKTSTEPKSDDKNLYPKNVKTTPSNPAQTPPPTTKPAETPKQVTTIHTVAVGQTYYSVARQYGVSVQDIYDWNNLNETQPLKVGQRLVINASGEANPPAKSVAEPLFHEVQKGDTLFNISKRYNVTPEQIQEWNSLKDNAISIGQKLKIFKE